MAKTLGRSINKARYEKTIKGIRITSDLDPTTHQQFVDDTMLYGQSTIEEEDAYKTILIQYTSASSQEINLEKLEIVFFNTNQNLEQQICQILYFKRGSLPCKYLGIPLDKGTHSTKLWDQKSKKIKQKWIFGKENGSFLPVEQR